METLEKKSEKVVCNDARDIVEGISVAFKVINKTVGNTDWVITGEKDLALGFIEFNLEKGSLNERRRFKRFMNNAILKPTLFNMNRFLRHLHSWNGERGEKLKVVRSVKEQKIIKARKEYVIARDQAKLLLVKYKKEKGDYYKKKLIN